MACLDTTVFLDLGGRAGPGIRDRARTIVHELVNGGEALTTTRLNVAELHVGVARSMHPQRELGRVARWLANVTILEFDSAAARAFGAVVGSLLNSGSPIGDMDALIASVALVNDQTLLTRNPRHFNRVPGLRVRGY